MTGQTVLSIPDPSSRCFLVKLKPLAGVKSGHERLDTVVRLKLKDYVYLH